MTRQPGPWGLDGKAWEVLDALMLGLSCSGTAERLGLGEQSVREVCRRLRRLAGASTRAGVVAWAVREGLYARDQVAPVITEAESRVLESLAGDRTRPQVARDLWLSENTVRTHMHRVSERWNVRGAPGLVSLALRSRTIA